MKKLMLSLILGLFLVSFAFAASDTTFSFESNGVSHNVELITASSNSATLTADGTSKELSEQESLPYTINEIGDVKIIVTHSAESASLGSLEATALIGVEESFSDTDTTKTLTVGGTTYTIEFITGSSTDATISVSYGSTTTSRLINHEQEGGIISGISISHKIGDIQFILTHAAENYATGGIEASFLMLIEKEFIIEAETPEENGTCADNINIGYEYDSDSNECEEIESTGCAIAGYATEELCKIAYHLDDEDENETEDEENETENETDDDQTRRGLGQIIRNRVKAGVYTNENGDQIRVRELAQNRFEFMFGNFSARTELEINEETEGNRTRLKVMLKNGRNASLKIMPNVASATALARLRLKVCNESRNCSIELKEVGEGAKARLVYETRARKTFRIFGLFKNREQVQTQIDAETGEVVATKRPWWAWMASEDDEADENKE